MTQHEWVTLRNQKLRFGQYKTYTLKEVYLIDEHYLRWLAKSPNPPMDVVLFLNAIDEGKRLDDTAE